jgi:hypothetical protein
VIIFQGALLAWIASIIYISSTEDHGTLSSPPALILAACKGNLTDLRRILHLSLAKGNPKRML